MRKMKQVGRPQEDQDGNLFRIDSVVSSAYNSQKELEWAEYRQPILAPKNSQIQFHEEFQLLGSDGELSIATHDRFPDFSHLLSRTGSPSLDANQRIFSSQSIRSKAGKGVQKTKEQLEEEKRQKIKRQTSAALKPEKKENVIQLHRGFRYDLINFRKYREIRLLSDFNKEFQVELRGPVPLQHIEELFEQFCEQLEVIPVKIMHKMRPDNILKLHRYSIQPPICKAFTNLLPMMQHLEQVVMIENNLTDKGSEMFLRAVYQLPNVKKLVFNKNQVGKKFITAFEQGMSAKPNMIVDLDLSDNKGANKIVTKLCDLLKNNMHIEKLNIGGMALDFLSARNISKLIEKSENLYDINLRDCGLRGERMKMIIEALGKNLHLTYFNISWNSLYFPENEVSISLAQTIQLHACLIHIDLSSTQLGREQIFFLMQEINDAPQIASIHLSHNFLEIRDRILLRGMLKATTKHPRRKQNLLSVEAQTTFQKMRLFKLRFLHEMNKQSLTMQGSQASQTDMIRRILHKDALDNRSDFDPTREGVPDTTLKYPLGSIREENVEELKKKQKNDQRLFSASSIHRVAPEDDGGESFARKPPSSGGQTFSPIKKQSSILPEVKKFEGEGQLFSSKKSESSRGFTKMRKKSTLKSLIGRRKARFDLQNLTFDDYPFDSLTGEAGKFHSFHEFSFYGQGGGGILPMPLAHRSDETTSTQKELQAMPYHNRIKAIRLRKQEEIDEIIRFREQMKQAMHEKHSFSLDFNFLDEVNVNQKLNKLYKSELPTANTKGQMIFSRILGHDDIAGAGEWIESSECWICNKWAKETVNFDLRRIAFKQILPASPEKPNLPPEGDKKPEGTTLPPIAQQSAAGSTGASPGRPPIPGDVAKTHMLASAPPPNVAPITSTSSTIKKPQAGKQEQKKGEEQKGDQKEFQLTPIELKKPMFTSPPQILSPFSLPSLSKRHERHDSRRLGLKRERVQQEIEANKPIPKTSYIMEVKQEAEQLDSRRIQMLSLAHPQIMPLPFKADALHDIIVDHNTSKVLPQIISKCYDKPVVVEHVLRDEDLLPFSDQGSDFDSSLFNSEVPRKKIRKMKKKQYNYKKMIARRSILLKQKEEDLPLLSRDQVTMYASFNNWMPMKMKPAPQNPDFYSATDFVPPGEHLLYFIKNDNDYMVSEASLQLSADLEIVQYKQSAILMNKIQVLPRDGPILANKSLVRKKVIVVKKFNKASSVFARWKADTEEMLHKMVELDVDSSKLMRFLKSNEEEIANIKKVFKKDFAKVKNIFLYYASISTYPRISWNDFTLFVNKCQIVDKNLNLATVDRLFIATNTSAGSSSGMKNQQGLCRFDFLEILVRVAAAKFRDPGICPTAADSLDKLLTENVFPNADEVDWQRFREEQLYNTECHMLFKKNEKELKNIYNHFTHPQKKQLNGKDVIELINNKAKLNVPDKSVMLSYGSSKMSCINLVESYQQQKKMLYVEFIQFLGRVSKEKYGESLRKMEGGDQPKFSPREEEEEQELPGEELYWKLDHLLTKIFKSFNKKLKFSYLKQLAKERGEGGDSPEDSPSPDTGRDDSHNEQQQEE